MFTINNSYGVVQGVDPELYRSSHDEFLDLTKLALADNEYATRQVTCLVHLSNPTHTTWHDRPKLLEKGHHIPLSATYRHVSPERDYKY